MDRELGFCGLVVDVSQGRVSVVTEAGQQVSASASFTGLRPGNLVGLVREGDDFRLTEFRPRPVGASWDAAAAGWRSVLGALPAETVIAALGEEDFSVRFVAEWELFHRGKQNLDLLVAGMKSPNWHIRAGCAALMDHLGDQRCVEGLLALLSDPHEKVRRAALHSVSCEACKEAPLCVDWVPEVARLAETDRIVRVRRVATLMLGDRREDLRARSTLVRLLEDRDGVVRHRARWALEGKRP